MKIKLSNLIFPLFIIPVISGCSNDKSAPTAYKILFTPCEYANVIDLPENATAGTKIRFKVETEDGYELDSVSARTESSSLALAGDNLYGFTFIMPSNDVKIDTSIIFAGYEINFNGDNHAYLIGLPTHSAAGKTVNFKVGTEPGYEPIEIAATSGEDTLSLVGDFKTGFTFIMPSSNAEISIKTRGFFFDITANSNDEVLITSIESTKFTVSDFIAGYRVNGDIVSSLSTRVRAGETVYVLANKYGIIKNVNIYANGIQTKNVELEISDIDGNVCDTYNAYEFVMPAEDVALTITAEENELNVDVKYNIQGICTEVIRNKEGEITNKFISGKRIFITLTFDEEKYFIKDVWLNYNSFNGYSLTNYFISKVRLTDSAEAKNVYTYLILSSTSFADDQIHVDVQFSEYEYSEKEFLGSYRAFSISKTNIQPSLYSDARKLNISADGIFKEDYSQLPISNLDETEKTFNIMSGPISKVVHYDSDMVWYPYTSSSNAIVGWKNWTENNSFRVEGSFETVALIELLNNDGSAVLNNFLRINGVDHMNVELEYEGDVVEDITRCKFVAKKNGVIVARYNGEDFNN